MYSTKEYDDYEIFLADWCSCLGVYITVVTNISSLRTLVYRYWVEHIGIKKDSSYSILEYFNVINLFETQKVK